MKSRQCIINGMGFLSVFTMLFSSQIVFAHGGAKSRAKIVWNGTTSLKAGNTAIQFDLYDKTKKVNLSDKDLSVVHEKVLHTFVFDEALVAYQHIHPEYKDGHWTVETSLPNNGTYFFYTQGKITDKKEDFTTFTMFEVIDGKTANITKALGDVRTGADGTSIITLDDSKLVAKKELMLMLNFSRTDGTKPEIKDYLGAMAHVVVTPSDGDTLLHVHPMSGNNANEMMLHVTFPEAGDYRVWVQFLDQDELKTVPLSVSVSK